MNYQQQKAYVGSRQQLFSVRESRIEGGRGDGVRIVDVHNGGNLEVTVTPDRCMDLYCVRYRGRCLNYITCNGLSHPAYYSVIGEGWSEAFSGGFLYTCGLSNIGLRSGDDWDAQKEHGCIANRPAAHLNIIEGETEEGPYVELCGAMQEGMLAGTNLTLNRTIRLEYLTDRICITDVVRNEGYRRAPHMLLYHCNMGYPLLQPDSRFHIAHTAVRPRTPFAESMIGQLDEILPPQDAMEEMCYYYTAMPDDEGFGNAVLENRREGLRVRLRFGLDTLPFFVQWKNFVKGEYVMGLEPANSTIDGREDAIERGAMQYLEGGEERRYRLIFELESLAPSGRASHLPGV